MPRESETEKTDTEVSGQMQQLVMHWRETTHEGDPLKRDGEYTCDQPWLEHSCNGGKACYTVRYNRHDNVWEPMWWHGNRGHKVIGWSYPTMEEAKDACLKHLLKMIELIGA